MHSYDILCSCDFCSSITYRRFIKVIRHSYGRAEILRYLTVVQPFLEDND